MTGCGRVIPCLDYRQACDGLGRRSAARDELLGDDLLLTPAALSQVEQADPGHGVDIGAAEERGCLGQGGAR